ncbi:MAG: Fic family protein [Clostridia bacterium]|nr:Fic family protein [Clostridia bacterium]
MSYKGLLKKADFYRDEINKKRPLSVEEIRELDNYFKIGVTYTSNALEGNTLTLSETKVLIEDGITVGGKPLRDCIEAVGHADAYDYMVSVARSEALDISEDTILYLHKLFYSGIDAKNAGKYRDIQVFITGTEYVPPKADEVPKLMSNFVRNLKTAEKELHPIALAAFAHEKLVEIHPFVDGNGRTSRLLMNLILLNKGYVAVSIPPVLRFEYIQALQAAQRSEKPDSEAFVKLIAECEIEAQKDYFRLFHEPIPKFAEKDLDD